MNRFKEVILLVFLLASVIRAQSIDKERAEDAMRLFVKIEDGLAEGSVDKFSNYFDLKTYISLSNGSSGYYSANQAYYVMKDFLSVYQPISFKLTSIVTDTINPFASGTFRFSNKGIRGHTTVFISLKPVEKEWRISQITIN